MTEESHSSNQPASGSSTESHVGLINRLQNNITSKTEARPSATAESVLRSPQVDAQPELDWNIDPDDLPKLFSDANERDRVRRLLNSAGGTATHSEKSRIELAQIKAQIAQELELKQAKAKTQSEIDNLSTAVKQGQAGA